MKEEYYKAYDERYKQVYQQNMLWSSLKPTKEVINFLEKYNASMEDNILDLGCGEGRDAIFLLEKGYQVLALDYSINAINKCNELSKYKYPNKFKQFDLIKDKLNQKFKFIYSIAVLHMFVTPEHRNSYLNFIKEHLTRDGVALICVMGNGIDEYSSDINKSFDKAERTILNNNKKIKIATTSCKIVNWKNLEKEIKENNLQIKEQWISKEIPEFNSSMCIIITKNKLTP